MDGSWLPLKGIRDFLDIFWIEHGEPTERRKKYQNDPNKKRTMICFASFKILVSNIFIYSVMNPEFTLILAKIHPIKIQTQTQLTKGT